MSMFRSFGYHDAAVFIPTDEVLHDTQAALLAAELGRTKSASKPAPAFAKYYRGVTHDGHGSFVVIFSDEVLTLDAATQQQIVDSLMAAYESTAWFENFVAANVFREQMRLLDDPSQATRIISGYIASRIACGYKVSRNELIDIFCDHVSEEDIDKASLIERLKHPDSFAD
jgi:hypothetical protein